MTQRLTAVLASDLLFTSRLTEPAARASISLVRVDDPDQLPPAGDVALLIVDWGARRSDWADRIVAWRDAGAAADAGTTRIVLVGPHVDLKAHAEARAAGLGPMIGRSRLMSLLPELFPSGGGV